MVVNWEEQERMRQMLTDAISVMCKNGLQYSNKFCVEGLLGITIDDDNIMLVNIKETVGGGMVISPRAAPATGRSPMGRFALTSPRRGRVKPVISSRGRGQSFTINRKRTLFPNLMKTTPHPVRQTLASPSEEQQNQVLVMPLPDQSGVPEGPPPKIKKEEPEDAQDDVIEIGDDDDGDAEATEEVPEIKQEPPDQQQPSSSTDSQSQEQSQQESKFGLDSDTNKSLTDFLDNLMTQHDVGPGSSSSRNSTPARGGTSVSQAQMTPKSEPLSMPWEQQQQPPATAVGYQSPTAQHGAPSFHQLPGHQSQESQSQRQRNLRKLYETHATEPFVEWEAAENIEASPQIGDNFAVVNGVFVCNICALEDNSLFSVQRRNKRLGRFRIFRFWRDHFTEFHGALCTCGKRFLYQNNMNTKPTEIEVANAKELRDEHKSQENCPRKIVKKKYPDLITGQQMGFLPFE